MMKKIVFLLLLLNISCAFANDYVCPNFFTCTTLNDPKSCTSFGGSPEFNVIKMEGPLFPGKYKYCGSGADYGDASQNGCEYKFKQTDNTYRIIFVSTSEATLYPKITAESGWEIHEDYIDCDMPPHHDWDPVYCMFTDEPGSSHFKGKK